MRFLCAVSQRIRRAVLKPRSMALANAAILNMTVNFAFNGFTPAPQTDCTKALDALCAGTRSGAGGGSRFDFECDRICVRNGRDGRANSLKVVCQNLPPWVLFDLAV